MYSSCLPSLHSSLSANLKHPVIFNFDLPFLLFKSWKICLEELLVSYSNQNGC
ncbi:hypothetical protein NC651_029185 [Populus alba x Populus x berolinensis]|nr:hypothetical protein NC651_029185 [Populus alba x Populus x berolinensis]